MAKVASKDLAIAIGDYYEANGLLYTVKALDPRSFAVTKTIATVQDFAAGTSEEPSEISPKTLKDAIGQLAEKSSTATVHNFGLTESTALVGVDHHMAEIHVEGGGDFTIAADDWEDGQWFRITHTAGVDTEENLIPSGFVGAYLRDGSSQDISNGLSIGAQDATFVITITDNGGFKFLNAIPDLAGSVVSQDTVIHADGTTLSLYRLNRYPDATTVNLAGKGDATRTQWFSLLVDPGEEVTIGGNTYTNSSTTPQVYSFEFTAVGAIQQLSAPVLDIPEIEADAVTDGTDTTPGIISAKTIKDAIDAKASPGWLPDAATIAARDALTDVKTGHRIRVLDAGDTRWAVFEARGDSPSPNWFQLTDQDNLNSPLPNLSATDAIAGTATTESLISAATLKAAITSNTVAANLEPIEARIATLESKTTPTVLEAVPNTSVQEPVVARDPDAIALPTTAANPAAADYTTAWVTEPLAGGGLYAYNPSGGAFKVDFTPTGYVFEYAGINDSTLRWLLTETQTSGVSMSRNLAANSTAVQSVTYSTVAGPGVTTLAREVLEVRVSIPGNARSFSATRIYAEETTGWTITRDNRLYQSSLLYANGASRVKVFWNRNDTFVQLWGESGNWSVTLKDSRGDQSPATVSVTDAATPALNTYALTPTRITIVTPSGNRLTVSRPLELPTWEGILQRPGQGSNDYRTWSKPAITVDLTVSATITSIANAADRFLITSWPTTQISRLNGSTSIADWYRLTDIDGTVTTGKMPLVSLSLYPLIEIFPDSASSATIPADSATSFYLPFPIVPGEMQAVPQRWLDFEEKASVYATATGKELKALKDQLNATSSAAHSLSFIASGPGSSQTTTAGGVVTLNSATIFANPEGIAASTLTSSGRVRLPSAGRVRVSATLFRATGSNGTSGFGYNLILYSGATTTTKQTISGETTWENERSYTLPTVDLDVAAGDTLAIVTPSAMTVWGSLSSISVAYVAAAGVVVPEASMSTKAASITVTGGKLINGATSANGWVGVNQVVQIALGANKALDAVNLSATGAVVTMDNSTTGRVNVRPTAETVVITAPEIDATTTTVRRTVSSGNRDLLLSTTAQAYNVGVTLQEGDTLTLWGDYNNDASTGHTMVYRVRSGASLRPNAWPATDHLVIATFPVTLTNSINVTHGAGNTTFRLRGYEVHRDSSVAVAVPTARTITVARILTAQSGKTIDGGKTSITGYEGAGQIIRLDLTALTEIDTVSITNGTITKESPNTVYVVPGSADATISWTTKAIVGPLVARSISVASGTIDGGQSSVSMWQGVRQSVKVDIAGDREIDTFSISSGSILKDGLNGFYVTPGAADGVITYTTKAAVDAVTSGIVIPNATAGSLSAGTWGDIPGMSFTLQPGTYDLTLEATAQQDTVAGGAVRIRLFNVTANAEVDYGYVTWETESTLNQTGQSTRFPITIAAATSFRVQGQCATGSTARWFHDTRSGNGQTKVTWRATPLRSLITIPSTTVLASPRTITATLNGAATTVNGESSIIRAEGSTVLVRLPLPANHRLSSVTGGTIEVAESGIVRVNVAAVDVAIVATSEIYRRSVSANVNVNGGSSAIVQANVPTLVHLTVPSNQQITSISATNGTARLIASSGAVEVTPNNAGDMVLSATLASINANLNDLALGAYEGSGTADNTAVFVRHRAGARIKEMTFTFRDRRTSTLASRSTDVILNAEGMSGAPNSGWTLRFENSFRYGVARNFTLGGVTYTALIQWVTTPAGYIFWFQDWHEQAWNTYGRFESVVIKWEAA